MNLPEPHELALGEERLHLLPQRAIWWAAQRAVVVADVHFGKEATFRSHAVPVPDLTMVELGRLTQLVETVRAERLIVLGDLLHSQRGRQKSWMQQVSEWRKQHSGLDVVLVRGNHDDEAGDPPLDWNIACVDEPWSLGSLALAHYPSKAVGAGLAGHLHPKLRLRSGRESLTLPCFYLQGETLILPAFAQFVDSAAITLAEGDRAFAIAEDSIIPLNAISAGN